MADAIQFSFHSLRFSSSSSLLTSFASSLTSLQPGLPPIPNSDKRVYPLLYSSSSAGDFARFALTPRKQLVSLKVSACPFLYLCIFFFNVCIHVRLTIIMVYLWKLIEFMRTHLLKLLDFCDIVLQLLVIVGKFCVLFIYFMYIKVKMRKSPSVKFARWWYIVLQLGVQFVVRVEILDLTQLKKKRSLKFVCL